jgi:hypothetical protein
LKLYFLGEKQPILRKDFWLIYFIFFNFFLLNLILLIALSNVMEQFINDILIWAPINVYSAFSISELPKPLALFYSSSLRLIQWNVHRLHTIPFLWKIHKTPQ